MLLFNENKLDEMCKILHELQRYVPSSKITEVTTLPDGRVFTHDNYKLHPVILGGDQMTVARICGAVAVRSNHEKAQDHLEYLDCSAVSIYQPQG